MGYRNTTFVMFDSDADGWAWRFMQGWNSFAGVQFDLYGQTDVDQLRRRMKPNEFQIEFETLMSHTAQAVVLVGDSAPSTHNLWDLQACIMRDMPVVVANLDGGCRPNRELCPPQLLGRCVIHVPFQIGAVRYAMDEFCERYTHHRDRGLIDAYYPQKLYDRLGLETS
jgi:hypothetical protein